MTNEHSLAEGGLDHENFNEEIDGGKGVVSDVVFVVFGMLLIGIVTRHALSSIPIPYTVFLLVSDSLLFWALCLLYLLVANSQVPSTLADLGTYCRRC